MIRARRASCVLIFGLWLGSWHKVPKHFGISCLTAVSSVLMRWLLVGSWMAADHQKDQDMIRSLGFSPPTPAIPFSREGRVAGNGHNDWSCLHDEASIKIPEVRHWESVRIGESSPYREVDACLLYGDRNSCTQDPPRPCPLYLFIWLFICIIYHILY